MSEYLPQSHKAATDEDYIKIQGGIPEVFQDKNGLWHYHHKYNEDDPLEVVTKFSPEDRGTVIIDGVEYDVALLRRFEGDPCERQSKKIGGKGYDRK